MFRIPSAAVCAAVLATALSTLQAQGPAPAAPIPTQIATAKKVFISNAGLDGLAFEALQQDGQPQRPYNQLYAAMKSWGHYDLVATPAEADLVFEIRFAAPLTGCDKITTYAPYLELTILDEKTHFPLWSFNARVQGANLKTTFDKNFTKGITAVMDQLRTLAAQPAPLTAETKQ